MNDREKIATLICLGTDDSCKEHCNLPSGKVCVRCETLADCLLANGVTVQKHGRWKGAGMGDYRCSLCSEVVSGNNHNYCPNCGAIMDGEADEH